MKTDYFLMVTDWDKHDKGEIVQEWDRVRKVVYVSPKPAEEARS